MIKLAGRRYGIWKKARIIVKLQGKAYGTVTRRQLRVRLIEVRGVAKNINARDSDSDSEEAAHVLVNRGAGEEQKSCE